MKNCMWYSFAQLFKNKLITLITTGMLAIGLILACYAGITYAAFHNSELMAKQYINYTPEDIYNINFFKYIYALSEEKNNIRELYYYIKEMPEVVFCGCYYYCNETLYISPDLAEMCGIDITNDYEYSAWVGKNIADSYPVGCSFDDGQTGESCVVKDVLDEGSYFLGDDFVGSVGDIICLDNYVVIDFDKLIEIDNEYITNGIINNFYFYVPESKNIELIKEKIKDKARSLNIDVYGINDLASLFEKNSREAMDKAGEKYYMPLMVLLSACVGMLIATMISYRLNKHDTNIMLLNGYTKRNLTCIFLFENIYKTIAAYIISILYWNNNEDAIQYIGAVDILPVIVAVGVLGFFIIFISSLPIIIKLKLKTPSSLVGEES